jgi:hypothetical protein
VFVGAVWKGFDLKSISTALYLISEMSGKDEFLKTDLFKDIRKLINIID